MCSEKCYPRVGLCIEGRPPIFLKLSYPGGPFRRAPRTGSPASPGNLLNADSWALRRNQHVGARSPCPRALRLLRLQSPGSESPSRLRGLRGRGTKFCFLVFLISCPFSGIQWGDLSGQSSLGSRGHLHKTLSAQSVVRSAPHAQSPRSPHGRRLRATGLVARQPLSRPVN